MFGTQHLGLFLVSALLLIVTPGQDTLYIVGRSLSQGRRAGVLSAFAITCGTAIHTLAAAYGLAAILATSAQAFMFIKLAGAAMNSGTYCTLAGVPPSKMPQGDAFFKRYQQRFGVPVQLYAPYAYDAVMAMAGAMQAADSVDPKVYLPKLQNLAMDGVTGPIRFDGNGDIRNGAITVRQFDRGDWHDASVVR